MEPMEPAPLCALPAGGRCPRGGSALTTPSLTTFWSSQPDSCNPRSSTLATPGTGHAVTVGREFPESDGQMLRWMGLVVGELGFKLLKHSGVRRALVSLGP